MRREGHRSLGVEGTGVLFDAPGVPRAEADKPAALAAPLIAGRYLLGEELGRGGMGTVHRARDTRLGVDVALKLATDGSPGARVRFQREVELGATLGQAAPDSFVRALDWGVLDDDRLYLTMDLVAGARTLDLDAGPLEERLRRVTDAAVIVARAHAAGVIHRDLKPSNFLVDDVGRVRLGDFGLARRREAPRITQPNDCFGTPGFMPPEQVRDAGDADERADVFALGVMLFCALSGRYPTSTDDACSPRLIDPAIPVELDALCRQALARERADRPDASALAARLREALARPTPSTRRSWRPGRAMERAAALATILTALAGLTRLGATTFTRAAVPSGHPVLTEVTPPVRPAISLHAGPGREEQAPLPASGRLSQHRISPAAVTPPRHTPAPSLPPVAEPAPASDLPSTPTSNTPHRQEPIALRPTESTRALSPREVASVLAPVGGTLEPNDSPRTAAVIELGAHDRIVGNGNDWYVVEVPAGRLLVTEATFDPTEGDLSLEVMHASKPGIRRAEGRAGVKLARLRSTGGPVLVWVARPGAASASAYRLDLRVE